MRKSEHRPSSVSVLQVALALTPLAIFATFFCSLLSAATPQPGFYPPLPETPTGTATPPPTACNVPEEFDDVTGLTTRGWVLRNNSQPLGNTNWFQGNTTVFVSHTGGATNSYIAANYQNGSGVATISNWLITPPVILQDGAQFSFWTRTVNYPLYPDRLQVRMSLNGASSDVGTTPTSVGDFTILLFDINGCPSQWTHVVATLSGIPSPVTGRLALRYFAENGGPNGGSSDYIGIDSLQYCCTSACGFPTPTPVPSPTTTPPPTPTGTPCSCGGLQVSGTVTNCSNVSRSAPIFNATIHKSYGSPTSSGSDGHYGFTVELTGAPSLVTVKPSKTRLAPGSSGIDTVDALAIQKHVLGLEPLSGCRLTAADTNHDDAVNTLDMIAIQRFFVGASTGLANVGMFSFSPTTRWYPVGNYSTTNQNYSVLIRGDVAEPFVP